MRQNYLLILLEKTSFIVVLFLLISKLKIFKKIFEKDKYTQKDLFVISIIFTLLSIMGTYNGIVYKGSILNTRIITIVSGGILFGPFVSIPTGIISGVHRLFMYPGSMTSIPCFISSIFAGVFSGLFYKKIRPNYKVFYGILVGIISENITIILIYLLCTPKELALDIIHTIYLPLVVGQFGIGFMVSIVNTIEKDKKDIEARKKAEMSALQRQINPHFIFNALNTIASFIRFDPQKARDLIISLSTYLRHNLEFNDNLIDIKKEIEQVKSYVDIEQARFGNTLKVIYDIDETNIKSPSLIIQPLVENAIIHGLEGCENGYICIYAGREGDVLNISITDDGRGMSPEILAWINSPEPEKREGHLGLYNIMRILKLYYGNEYGLKAEVTEDGTTVTLRLPDVRSGSFGAERP